MIKIVKDLNNKPATLSSLECLSSLRLVVLGDQTQINSEFYRGIEIEVNNEKKREVVEALYHNNNGSKTT